MWDLDPTSKFERRFKEYGKKHSPELLAVMGNLNKFCQALTAGAKPQEVKVGFVHPEPKGVLAITEQGGGGNLAATRLYVYPDETASVVHLITLGGKNSQPEDIQYCNEFVESLRQEAEGKDGQEEV